MKRIFAVMVMGLVLATALMAQSAKRRAQSTQGVDKKEQSVRKFPVSPTVGDDVTWRRDLYRVLDLSKDANAPLYYPVEPVGKQMNMFTYLFRLLLAGRITAYNYSLDGNENFEASNRVNVKDIMERYGIYYEIKDARMTVAPQDIPSAEVKRYYIKESSYFDQRTGTYHQRVVAICPVLMRDADEFASDATPYPLFWLNYDDVSDYLSRLPVMASNLNNATNMTAADFFALNRYDGKIYKTNNMQGRVLANYCKDEDAMLHEQERIEKELTAFEAGIWTTRKPVSPSTFGAPDSSSVVAVPTAASKKTVTKSNSATRRAKAPSAPSSSSRVSARRQRR